MIVFPCAGCGQKLQVPDSFSGKLVRCSACQHVMPSPTPTAVRVAAEAALPEIARDPSNPAQAGQEGGITCDPPAPLDCEQSKKASSNQLTLREALEQGLAGGERYRILDEIARWRRCRVSRRRL